MVELVVTNSFELPFTHPVIVFAILLVIILLSPIILKPLRVPGIIGLILAGLAIGPHGFHLIEHNFAIELFGEVGLLYIMFLAGLELDLANFIRNRTRSLSFGMLTFTIPLLLGFPLCLWVLNLDWMASLLVSSMFATHTLVAYPIVSRFNLSGNEAVSVTVGGTILTDTLVLLILAVITGMKNGNQDISYWLLFVGKISAFAIIVYYLFPPLTRWFFKTVEVERSSRFIFVLSLMFASSVMALLAGVEPLIGAFLAGLSLNRFIPHTSPLMSRIEFTGNAIFIPIFLIDVGMMINLGVLKTGNTALIVAGVLTSMALFSKWIASWFTQKLFQYSSSQRQVIFGLSSSHAAATLAVIIVGMHTGIVDENILNGTIILILVTCTVATLVTQKSARDLALQQDSESDQPVESAERFLVSVANPDNIEDLLDFSVMLRNQADNEPVYALTVVNDNNEVRNRIAITKQKMKAVEKHAAITGTPIEIITRIDVSASQGITRTADELLASDIIMGWNQKTTPFTRFFGTILDKVLLNSSQVVTVCRFGKSPQIISHIRLIIPPLIEYENEFLRAVKRIRKLSEIAASKITLYSENQTYKSFLKKFSTREPPNVQYVPVSDWEYQNFITDRISPDDLIILLSSREGSVSHKKIHKKLPGRINEMFRDQNMLIIFT